jgi:tRNA pseudouridine32 synthase/23S rRNA pseudouridine746 synthase
VSCAEQAQLPVPASRLQLPPGPWRTLLEGMCAYFPRIDPAQWQDRFARGRVLDEAGQPLAADAPYRAGMQIRYFREVAQEPVLPGGEYVVHQDAHLLVAYKPHYLPVTPTGAWVRQTLLARLVALTGNTGLVPLHRIDRDTAGLVMFSTDPASRGAYQGLFRERRIRKTYQALAPALPGLVFPHIHRSRLEAGEPFFRMREVDGPANSESVIDVLARTGDSWTYRLEPVTGRKHQLRVHMAALGAPILHDRYYPQLQAQGPDDPQRPLQLLARALEFVDPLSGQQRRFCLPDDEDAGAAQARG